MTQEWSKSPSTKHSPTAQDPTKISSYRRLAQQWEKTSNRNRETEKRRGSGSSSSSSDSRDPYPLISPVICSHSRIDLNGVATGVTNTSLIT
jgi:hypothetical protein